MDGGRFAKGGWAMVLGALLVAGCGGGGDDPSRPLPRLNDEPVLAAVGDRTVRPGQPLAFAVSASDTEGDPLTFSAEGLPAGALFDPASRTFSWTPGESAEGVHYLAFVVTDPTGSDFETIAITVLPDPLLPPGDFSGITVFGQSIPAQDLDGDLFPGQGNVWDLDSDLALFNGGDNQFEGAMALSVSIGGSETFFPSLSHDDLTWNAPFFTQADGVKTVAVGGPDFSLAGSFSALLGGTSDSRLQQTVDLSAVPAGTPLTLTWVDEEILDPGNFVPVPPALPENLTRYDLVVRDVGGSELRRIDISSASPPSPVTLSEFAGQPIQISFEARNTNYGFIVIDDVSLQDSGGREFLFNGRFETGDLRGWKTALTRESQNVATSAQTVAGLRVTRSFFTHPSRAWGRWVDVFENTGTESVQATVRYTTKLGAYIIDAAGERGTARIYATPSVPGALSIWDARELLKKSGLVTADEFGSRDVGLVFGDLTPTFTSLTTPAALNGSPDIALAKTFTVDPGERVALATFVVLDAVDTGETAAALTAPAAGVDAANRGIVQGFRSDPQYREGIPDDIFAIIGNWP